MGTESVESRRSPFKRLVQRWCQAGPKVLGTRRIRSRPSHYWPHGFGLQQSVTSSLHDLSNPHVYGDKFLCAKSTLWRSGRGGKWLLFSPYIPNWPRNSTPIILQGEGNRYNPGLIPRPYWWPMLRRCANKRYLLAKKGNHEVLLWPSKCHGFHQPCQLSLSWDLYVFRLEGDLYWTITTSFLSPFCF